MIGLARNKRLRTLIEQEMKTASERQAETGKAARELADLDYQTLKSWSRERRVVAKAEQLERKEPRYVVTSLSAKACSAEELYEQIYCARGEMENRIKEQLSLFSDRMSAQTLRANQLRLYFSSLAYTLMLGLRRWGALRHGLGAGADGNDSAATVEDRRAGADHGAAGGVIAG